MTDDVIACAEVEVDGNDDSLSLKYLTGSAARDQFHLTTDLIQIYYYKKITFKLYRILRSNTNLQCFTICRVKW